MVPHMLGLSQWVASPWYPTTEGLPSQVKDDRLRLWTTFLIGGRGSATVVEYKKSNQVRWMAGLGTRVQRGECTSAPRAMLLAGKALLHMDIRSRHIDAWELQMHLVLLEEEYRHKMESL